MAVTASTLKVRFGGEFDALADAYVDAVIAAASEEVDPRVFGAKTDEGVHLLAAHKLAEGQFGQPSRLSPKAAKDSPHGTTTHGCAHDALAAQCGGGFYVVGVPL